MSEYKISFKLIKQQTDEMNKVVSQLNTFSERINAASSKLGQDELLQKARMSLTQCIGTVGEVSEILGIASATLAEIIEEYTGTETKNVSQAEGTRAHTRDFYKNPVVISDSAGEGFAGGVVAGAGIAGTAHAAGADAAVSGVMAGSQATVAGAEVATGAAVAGAEVAAQASVAGTVAGAEAALSGAAVGVESNMSGVALGAGVAVAGMAGGVGAAIGGVKLSQIIKNKSNKPEPIEQQTDITEQPATGFSIENEVAISRAEEALKKAQLDLENI